MDIKELPAAYAQRMQIILGNDWQAFARSMTEEPERALRVNRLKCAHDCALPFSLTPVPDTDDCYFVDGAAGAGKHPLHEAGAYYLQEPSAARVTPLLKIRPGQRVLDLCAAPGGKSVAIAAALGGTGLLVSNEIHPARARILSQNIERLGVRNCLVLNETPERIADRFPRFFDAVLVDAPCSGEGMFRKNPEAVSEWSEENVAMCAARQRAILTEAERMLRPSGRLVYSTCTFSPEENEENVRRFLDTYTEFHIESPAVTGAAPGLLGLGNAVARLYPHRLRGEGHFLAVLRRDETELPRKTAARSLPGSNRVPAEIAALWQRWQSENLRADLKPDLRFGDALYALPDPPDLSGLHVLRAGLQLGFVRKNRFEPAHALAAALRPLEAQLVLNLPSDGTEIRRYLTGEEIDCDQRGWVLVCTDGVALGWLKSDGVRGKNHYPKGLRKKL